MFFILIDVIFLILFLVELILLFYFSRSLSRLFFKFLFSFCRKEKITIWLFSLFFLPGVVIHELAHLVTALVLFVPIADLEFIPKSNGNDIKLGSVKVAKADFLRRGIIAFAPMSLGVALLIIIFNYFPDSFSFSRISILEIVIFVYTIFQVSNTMFISKKDLEVAKELLIVVLIIVLLALFIKGEFFYNSINNLLKDEFLNNLKNINIFLLIPLVIDIVFVLLIKIFLIKTAK